MTKHSDKWSFDGGFPPDVYGRLCRKLKLKNKGSQSRPRKFTPYKSVK